MVLTEVDNIIFLLLFIFILYEGNIKNQHLWIGMQCLLSSLTAFGSSYYLLLNIFFMRTNLLENILAALPQNLALYST